MSSLLKATRTRVHRATRIARGIPPLNLAPVLNLTTNQLTHTIKYEQHFFVDYLI